MCWINHALEAIDIPVFGPNKAAAELEGVKNLRRGHGCSRCAYRRVC